MKTSLFVLLLHLSVLHQLSAQCQVITLPYGQVEIDINRGYKIITTQDGNFVIAGEWNNEAFLMKINGQGGQLALKKYGSAITGQSSLQDVVEAPDGGFVAVGECDNCGGPTDTLTRVIAIKTDANLNLDATIGVKKFGTVTLPGGFVTANQQTSPRIVRTGDTYLLATSLTLGATINWEDVGATKLSATLSSLWVKSYNTGYFEAPSGMSATADGFIIPINRAFLTHASLLKINTNGDLVWTKTFATDMVRGITYLPGANDVVVIGDRTPAGQNKQALLMRFNAATGAAKDSLLFGDVLGDEGHDIKELPGGDLLAGIVTNRPNPFGTYATSRIYRIHANPLSVNCYYLVPNPDNITNMSLRSIVPLSDNGKDFAVTGIRGFYNRTFFHTRIDCEVSYASATICPGDSYTLPDGTMVNAAGTYNTILPAMNGCDSIVQTTVNQYASIPMTAISAVICPGDSYTLPNGVHVTLPGVYDAILQASNGCDSLIQTTVSLYAPIPLTGINVSLCPGDSHSLPDGQMVSSAGIYDVTLTAANGCDSLVRTTVMILTSPVTSVSVALCPGETYTLENGQVVEVAGVYDITYTATNGCDSIVRTMVEQLDAPTLISDYILCAGEVFVLPDGTTTTTPGDYDFPFVGPNGCTGIHTYGIFFYPAIQVGNVEILAENGQGNGSISLSGVSGGAGGGYNYLWSNGATTPTIDSLTFGTYQVTITDQGGCTAIFEYTVQIVGLNDLSANVSLQITPNPFFTNLSIALEVENPGSSRFEIRLFDTLGRLCQTSALAPGVLLTLDAEYLPDGIYFAQLIENEKVVSVKRVVKQ